MKEREASLDHLVTDLKAVARDSQELLKATAVDMTGAAGRVRHRLEQSLESARATCARLQDETARAAKKADRILHDHPYEAAGVAFGIGLLIGVLATRRCGNRPAGP